MSYRNQFFNRNDRQHFGKLKALMFLVYKTCLVNWWSSGFTSGFEDKIRGFISTGLAVMTHQFESFIKSFDGTPSLHNALPGFCRRASWSTFKIEKLPICLNLFKRFGVFPNKFGYAYLFFLSWFQWRKVR